MLRQKQRQRKGKKQFDVHEMMNKKATERDREQGESGIKMNKERQREKTGKKIDADIKEDLSKGSSLKTRKRTLERYL